MKYLTGKIKIIIFFLLCFIISFVVFYLYNLETEAVLYAFVLCLAIGIVFICADLFLYLQKIKILKRIENAPLDCSHELPKANNSVEREYQEIIKRNIAEAEKIFADDSRKISEAEEFYSIWVHQIKTPIAAMKVLIDSGAERELLSSELFKIERYSDMALSYIRIGSGSDYVIKEADLEKAVKNVVKLYAPLFIQKNLSVTIKNVDIKVITDEKWIEFALEQVISNAIKYSRNGNIEIYVNDKVLVVEDHGSGIAPEDLPRVFEKGFTGLNGRSGKWSTGIGLYLCKKVLTGLGHSIKIESTENVGTKVFIDLNTTHVNVE